jgi:hypothetical protein
MKLGNRNRTDNLQPPEKGKGVRKHTQNRPISETNGVRTKQNGLASDQNVLYKNIKVKFLVLEESAMKKVSLKRCAAVCAAIVLMAGVLQADPIAGIFDSRTDSTIVCSGWLASSGAEEDYNKWEIFLAWGTKEVNQWYIEAHRNEGNAGLIQLNSNGPWFGDEPEGVVGYEGQITEWTLSEYTGEFLGLVLTGTAVLDKKHMMPEYEDMSPVPVTFEMGFSRVPEIATYGTPSYVVFTIPEPATMVLLGLGGLFLRKCR